MANLLQRYLGNYVMGLNKEALKISVWQGSNTFCFFFFLSATVVLKLLIVVDWFNCGLEWDSGS